MLFSHCVLQCFMFFAWRYYTPPPPHPPPSVNNNETFNVTPSSDQATSSRIQHHPTHFTWRYYTHTHPNPPPHPPSLYKNDLYGIASRLRVPRSSGEPPALSLYLYTQYIYIYCILYIHITYLTDSVHVDLNHSYFPLTCPEQSTTTSLRAWARMWRWLQSEIPYWNGGVMWAKWSINGWISSKPPLITGWKICIWYAYYVVSQAPLIMIPDAYFPASQDPAARSHSEAPCLSSHWHTPINQRCCQTSPQVMGNLGIPLT